MNARKILSLLLCIVPVCAVSAQQITRFALVDTSRIYTQFYRDSKNVREFDAKKKQYQGEIQRMTDEVKTLRQQKVDADTVGDAMKAARLETEIAAKTSTLLEYSKAKNTEIDGLKKKLMTDDEFYSILYDEITKIAQADGYSMVLSLQDDNSILWYSPTVDITDKVIRNMTSRQ